MARIDIYESEQAKQNDYQQSVSETAISEVNRYKDFLNINENALPKLTYTNMRGRKQETFPIKLFKVLDYADSGGYSSIISWLPHGRTFKIHDVNRFKKEVMSKFFSKQNLIPSIISYIFMVFRNLAKKHLKFYLIFMSYF